MTARHSTEPTTASTAAPVIATEVVLPGVVEPDGLVIRQRELPPLATGQALIKVEATGVSFAEQGMRRGRYPGQPKFPFVLGYDLVGTVAAIGPLADGVIVGTRVAVATKTGGWASHSIQDAADLVVVPAGLDPAEVETVVVNGITAYQMLHRSARVKPGQTILVHGASGGVGSILAQIARHEGIRVLGTAAKRNHAALRAQDVEPIDYNDDVTAQVRRLAPGGVDAVFDHMGPDSFPASFALLAPGGTLVAYGSAERLDDDNSMIVMFLGMLTRLYTWNLLPNKRRANFYNFWAGHLMSLRKFRQRQHDDLTAVLQLLEQGAITAPIAARFPLTEAAAALTLAESRTTAGKVILLP
jgi:NADPH:quinone reductase-like Zn-dependent oxidoreductase